MRNVYTVRLSDEYSGMLAHINLELQNQGIEVKESVLIKTVLLTGIRAINQMMTQGKNIFDYEGNQETDD